MAAQIRTSISIPADIKARMDAVKSVSWSAVATYAFHQKLAEIAKREGARNMQEALERLRASKRKHSGIDYQCGLEAGERWAMQQAEAPELANIAKWQDSFPGGDWGHPWEDKDDGEPFAVMFAWIVDPSGEGNRSVAKAWWNEIGYSKLPAAEFVHGFADGAVDVWEKV